MKRAFLHLLGIGAAAAGVLSALSGVTAAAGPTFRADYRFTGTALTGFKPLGQADWKVVGGEIIGTPKDAGGGWLLVDGKEFQDLQIYASVKCAAGCKAGYLMRAEKTPDGGLKGILMSLTEGDLLPYMVTIDAQGREVSREVLAAPAGRAGGAGGGAGAGARQGGAAAAPAGGGADSATARMTAATAALNAGRAVSAGPAPPLSAELAAQYPKESRLGDRSPAAYVAGVYNDAEVLITDNRVQPRFNGGSLGGGGGANRPVPESAVDGFGQIGLYVGGTAEVRFKDFMYKDILNHT